MPHPYRPPRPSDSLVELLIWLRRLPRRRRLARRRRLGLCYHCGYDVHGTVGRCPECGRYPIFRQGAPPDWPDIVLEEPGDAAGPPDM